LSTPADIDAASVTIEGKKGANLALFALVLTLRLSWSTT
jgi:hypothetical protein